MGPIRPEAARRTAAAGRGLFARLSPDPLARHASAEDLAADLEAFVRAPRRRAWAVAAAAVLLAATAACVAIYAGRSGPASNTTDPAKHAAADDAGVSLDMRVWNGERYVGLTTAAPLRTGDQFQVRVEASAPVYVGLFLFSSDGKLQLLAERRSPSAGPLHFPPDEGQAAPLTGAAGTECLLVCVSRSGRAGLEELQACWGERKPWPALPGESVFHLSPEGVKAVGGRGRGVGTPVDRPDPEGDVRRRLEALRSRLGERFDYFEGLAFAHQE